MTTWDVLILEGVENREIELLDRICSEIRIEENLSDTNRRKLLRLFPKRFKNAGSLVKKGAVKKFIFRPSGRVIWEVKGRGGDYQILPESNFCNCNDYYFRVINRKRQLCYHILAQKLAESLKQFEVENLIDSQYRAVTRKWRGEQRES